MLTHGWFCSVSFTQALVEKDWLAFGHPFSDRSGMPTISGSGNMPYELSRQSSTGSFSSSPLRQPSGAFISQASSPPHAQTSNNCSPIFLQVCCSLNIFFVKYCVIILGFLHVINNVDIVAFLFLMCKYLLIEYYLIICSGLIVFHNFCACIPLRLSSLQ